MCIRDRSYDEELGCTGAPPMIETMQGVVPKGAVALIGEPSRMKVITGHKGGTGYNAVSYTHLRAHETVLDLVCRLLLEKKKNNVRETDVHR